jgi:hypothetical protein
VKINSLQSTGKFANTVKLIIDNILPGRSMEVLFLFLCQVIAQSYKAIVLSKIKIKSMTNFMLVAAALLFKHGKSGPYLRDMQQDIKSGRKLKLTSRQDFSALFIHSSPQ